MVRKRRTKKSLKFSRKAKAQKTTAVNPRFLAGTGSHPLISCGVVNLFLWCFAVWVPCPPSLFV